MMVIIMEVNIDFNFYFMRQFIIFFLLIISGIANAQDYVYILRVMDRNTGYYYWENIDNTAQSNDSITVEVYNSYGIKCPSSLLLMRAKDSLQLQISNSGTITIASAVFDSADYFRSSYGYFEVSGPLFEDVRYNETTKELIQTTTKKLVIRYGTNYPEGYRIYSKEPLGNETIEVIKNELVSGEYSLIDQLGIKVESFFDL